MKLWLDDVRDPRKHAAADFIWAKTYEEAVTWLKTGDIEFASLDHDLGLNLYDSDTPLEALVKVVEEKTGYDVVCWLEEHPEFWPKDGVKVHSGNPVGAARMRQVIDRHYEKKT